MQSEPVRCLVIADFTVSGLVPYLATSAEPASMTCNVAPFDQVVPLLLDGGAQCWGSSPEVAIVWTRPEAAIKTFGRLLEYERVSLDVILAEVDEFVEHLRVAAKRVTTVFVPTWTLPGYDRGLGLLDMNAESGHKYTLLRMNARLVEGLATLSNVFVLDAGRWLELAGPSAVNPKLWHLGKIAFGPEIFRLAAADIRAGVGAIRGQSRKLIVLDLDNTLWGGIVGDLGWENLTLGGHNPIGEAYVAFQRALKGLTRRGIVLGIVSKNTEAVALEAIDRHPEMILRRNDFVGWRINWDDKARNLVDLANDVNLGLESLVFIDDSPVERARVREALPQVFVPEWPADKLLYQKALKELTCFDAANLSAEDHSRTAMYVSDRLRTESRRFGQSLQDHLESLGLRVMCDRLGPASLQRAAQLFNKTNQMNLTTRRMTEHELQRWAETRGNCVLVFRVADRFGDYGLTGLASLALDGTTASICDFILSCRVLGRGVEEAILHCLTEGAREFGADRVVAICRPTPRNGPCQDFFQVRSGFRAESHDGQFVWPLVNQYPLPRHIELQTLGHEAESPGSPKPARPETAPLG